jgi:hypothetical protein
MQDTRYAQRILMRKPSSKQSLGRSRHTQNDEIKDIKQYGFQG